MRFCLIRCVRIRGDPPRPPFLAATAGPDDRDSWSIAGPTPDFVRGLEGGIEGSRTAAGLHRDLAVLRASRAFEPARPWAGWRPPL